jgi:hypothetical protein
MDFLYAVLLGFAGGLIGSWIGRTFIARKP